MASDSRLAHGAFPGGGPDCGQAREPPRATDVSRFVVAELACDPMAATRHAVSSARSCALRAQRTARGERRSRAATIARRVPARHLPVVQRRPARPLVESRSAHGPVRRRIPHNAIAAQAAQAAYAGHSRGYGVPFRNRGLRERAPARAKRTWITPAVIDAYVALHEKGNAHSVESWREGRLVGGLYGVAIGRMFFGESMFASEPDASKIALAHLVEMLPNAGARSSTASRKRPTWLRSVPDRSPAVSLPIVLRRWYTQDSRIAVGLHGRVRPRQ